MAYMILKVSASVAVMLAAYYAMLFVLNRLGITP